jgi:uncharacterized hydrophobic protein (TIGR00271 family)
MLRLRSSIATDRATPLIDELRGLKGVRRIAIQADEGTRPAAAIITADVEPAAADRLVGSLSKLGVRAEDYVLSRVEVVAPIKPPSSLRAEHRDLAWVEVVGEALESSRPLARYLALISVAAVIAALGVITANAILIVGAMAVSPDLQPICATCVGIVGRRRALAWRAFRTLAIGLFLVMITAAILSAALNLLAILPNDFALGEGGLGGLARVDYSTVLIAFAAGAAAMLSFETRASTVVGVAISVTTIPASAYIGVAIGAGVGGGAGALVVLLTNVALLVVSGSLTLVLQRRIR